MIESTVYYDNGAGIPSLVRYSGGAFCTSVVRFSADITGLPTTVEGLAIDDDNYAIGAGNNDEIWYMAGHYTSTILNSVTQPSLNNATISLSFNDDNIAAKGNFTGSVTMTYFAGHVTSVILSTFDPTTQTNYTGTANPKGLFLERRSGEDKVCFWVIRNSADGGPVYMRLASIFSSVVEDQDEAGAGAASSISPTHWMFEPLLGTGGRIAWTKSSSSGDIFNTRYFIPTSIGRSPIPRPAWVTGGGMGDVDNDAMQDRMFTVDVPDIPAHTLTLTQEVSIPVSLLETVTQTFVFGESVFGGVLALLEGLILDQEVSTAGSIFQHSISHILDLFDLVSIVLVESVPAQTINFSHSAVRVFQGIPLNTLTLTDDAIGLIVNSTPVQDFEFSQEVIAVSVQNEDASQSFSFTEILAAWIGDTSDCIYAPQPQRTIPFAIGTRVNVTLQDNLPNPTNTITIRNPGFGNLESVEIFRTVNISRHREKTIFRDSIWPKTKSISIVSDENTKAESITLLSFLSATLGEEIKLIDWENRTWIGIVTNPENAVRDLGNCRFRFTIDFMGRLVTTGQTIFDEGLPHTLVLSHIIVGIVVCTENCGGGGHGIPVSDPADEDE